MLMEKNNRFDSAVALKHLYNFKKIKDKAQTWKICLQNIEFKSLFLKYTKDLIKDNIRKEN